MALARRPTSFTGPTQDGQPNAHAQACERLQAAAQEIGQDLEEPLGQADAAGVRVVQVDRRIEALGLHEPLLGRLPRGHRALLDRRGVAQPGAEVTDVAQQEDGRQVMEEIGHRAQAVDQLLARGAHALQRRRGHGQPHARRLLLLLWQIDLARAHVLQRAVLDLLEADHLLGHQHLALLGQVRGVLAALEPAEDPHALGADGVGEVVHVDALDVGDLLLVLAEVELLHLVRHALDQVDRLGVDRREGAAPVDLGDDLPLLRLLVVARGGVEHHEVVGGHRAQREVIGGIGLRRPVIAVPRAVQQPLVLERGQLPAHLDLAEPLALDHRQLEGRALEVVHQDERVVGIDPRVLGRRAEEIVGVRDHELIQRRAGGHEDRGGRPPSGARPGRPAATARRWCPDSRPARRHRGGRCPRRARARWSRPRRAPRPTGARARPCAGGSAGSRRGSRARCPSRRWHDRPRPP